MRNDTAGTRDGGLRTYPWTAKATLVYGELALQRKIPAETTGCWGRGEGDLVRVLATAGAERHGVHIQGTAKGKACRE